MKSPKKGNAAAMRRARAELLAAREAAKTPLPTEFVTWLEHDYCPAAPLRDALPRLRPFITDALTGSDVRGTESLRKHTTHLAHFAVWATLQGLPLDRSALNREHIDEYSRTGMPSSSDKSRSDRRSRLRSIADQLHPDLAPHPTVSIPREAIKPPYADDEMTGLRRAITLQCPAGKGRAVNLSFGCGAGAGIDSPELKQLRGRSFEDHGDDGILIHIPGARARTVWVLREYEPFIRLGLQGLADDEYAVGRVPTRHNVASEVYSKLLLLGALPKLEQSRLRTTWLANLMSRPVPLAVILNAAGLRSTRTLFDLLPHLSPATSPADLRDGGAQ